MFKVNVDFDEGEFRRKIMEAARSKGEEFILEHAEAVKAEMGSEAAGLTFSFDPATSDDEALGKLHIHGPEDVAKTLRDRLQARLKPQT